MELDDSSKIPSDSSNSPTVNPPTSPLSSVFDPSWQVESLIKAALVRTRERFMSYFLALVVSLLLAAAAVLVVVVVGFLLGLIGSLTKSVLLVVFLGIPLLVLGALVGVYIGAWIQLVLIDTLIQKERVGVMATFSKLRPYVWGYYFYTLFFSLFIFGLIPFGILSLGIIFILWSLWSIFSVFVYLEKRKKNLDNLWYSRDLINQRFWGIIGRLVLIYATFYFIFFLLISSRSSLLIALASLASWFVELFIMSYFYEMYRQLPEPQTEPKKPVVWVFLSVLGWVVMILGIILLAFQAPNLVKNFPWDKLRQSYLQAKQAGTGSGRQILPKVSSPNSVEALIQSANVKLATANQLAGKGNLTQSEKDQVIALDQGAIADLKQATQKDPSSEEAWYALGKTYWTLGKVVDGAYDWAVDSFKKASALKPEDSRNYFYLGITYKKLGDLVKAREFLNKTLDLLPAKDPERAKVEKELQGL